MPMSTLTTETLPLPLIKIDSKHKPDLEGPSCHTHGPVDMPTTRRHKYRMVALALVHVYIAFHMIAWHIFGIEIWGKTAMMGVPSLAKGTINTASIMVLLLLG